MVGGSGEGRRDVRSGRGGVQRVVEGSVEGRRDGGTGEGTGGGLKGGGVVAWWGFRGNLERKPDRWNQIKSNWGYYGVEIKF